VKISDGVYEQEQWPSFKGVLRQTNSNAYIIQKIRKRLNRRYTKGHVNSDGWIDPLVLGEFADYIPLFY
jgi:hypothetical protein